MTATALTHRYAVNLHGALSCYDRIIVTGTLPGACYAGGMTSFLYPHGIRVFDYPRFAEPLRDRIRERPQQDNAFLRIADLERAQALADVFSPEALHQLLIQLHSQRYRTDPVESSQ